MSADMRYAIDNLARSARNAGWDMTVNTALVRKLIAAAELAEAQVEIEQIVEAIGEPFARDERWRRATLTFAGKVSAYRQATGR